MFIEDCFPISLAKKITGGLEFNTTTTNNQSGLENRNINWPLAKSRFNITKSLYSSLEVEILQKWFRVARGRGIGFRFRDEIDHLGERELLARGDGQQQNFQLKKIYQVGKYNFVRKISKPVKDTVFIYIDQQKIDAEVNLKTGLVSLSNPPERGQEIRADFHFDVPVRFNSDFLQISYHSFNLYKIEQLELVEILL